jgi:hypothetical protein
MENNFEAYSYAYKNLSDDVLIYQKKVFDKFNLPLIQVQGDFDHGDFLKHILTTSSKKYIIFFDADAIPLKDNFFFC